MKQAVKALLRPLRKLTAAGRRFETHNRWVSRVYTPFGMAERERIILSICRFCHINRPIDGYYMEFGCHEAKTMRLAWRHTQYLFNWKYLAFDSFEGLPDIQPIDRQEIWKKGKLKTGEEQFISLVTRAGMPAERLRTIKGFYNETLTPALTQELLPAKAAVIYIDCDLYHSTVPILKFIPPFLQVGTIIVFDDWNCFTADPERGERLAWREFREAHPALRFEPFVATAEAQSFVCVGTQ